VTELAGGQPGTRFRQYVEPSEPVPDNEMDLITRLVATDIRYDPHPFISEGSLVEVIRGHVLRKDRTTKLVIAVTLIRQAAVVEIHPANIVPV